MPNSGQVSIAHGVIVASGEPASVQIGSSKITKYGLTYRVKRLPMAQVVFRARE